jgi:NAD(P)-dependent dehydrogenase (short-subunit alcohol dehydrogenase family)
MTDGTIVVAGATGNLGGRIARALCERGASVKALVRHGTAGDKLDRLQELGVITIARVDLSSASQMTSCLVSAQCFRGHIIERAPACRLRPDTSTTKTNCNDLCNIVLPVSIAANRRQTPDCRHGCKVHRPT